MARGKLLSCSILFAVLDFSGIARTVKSHYKLFSYEIHNIVCKQTDAYIVSKFIKSNFYKYEKHLNYNFCVFKALRYSYVSLLVTV